MPAISPVVECCELCDVQGAKFAFLFHAPGQNYVQRAFGLDRWNANIEQELMTHPPLLLKPITLSGDVIGANVALPWTPEMIARNVREFKRLVLETLQFIRDALGIQYVGLGALIPSYLHQCRGLDIHDVFVTTGHAATSLMVARIMEDAVRAVGIDARRETCAIIGAAGSMGRTVFRLLADRFGQFLLFERRDRTRHLLRDVIASVLGADMSFKVRICTSNDLGRLTDAAAVVVVSNAHQPYLFPEHLVNTAVVVDDAKPSGICSDTIAAVHGKTLVLECLGQGPPEIDFGFDFGFAHPRYCYGCAFEAWIAAELDLRQHLVTGFPTPVQLDVLRMYFHRLGITRAPFTESGGRPIRGAEIEQVALHAAGERCVGMTPGITARTEVDHDLV